MKHVTLFSQLAEYQTFMGGGDSLNPNISYVKEDGKVYATGDVSEDFSGAVVYARYNISDDMSKTGLFSTSNVKSLKVDGEVMEFEPEVEMNGELTVLGENISFDMENETYTVPEEYLFDNTKLSTLAVRPANGDISVYNAVCLSISMGGMNYPMPLMFEEAEDMGIVIDYENNMIDLSPMLEMMSTYYPGNSSACMLSVDENYETLVFGDTLVSFSGISGGMPTVFDFESAGEYELEVLLKDGESLGGMFANNFEFDYGLVEVVIPDTVKYLDEYCFAYDNNLTKVTIPESVESIGSDCFRSCSSLTDVCFLGDGVKSIGSYAFGNCENLTTITLPDSIETLEYSAFYECKQLNSVKLPNGISALNSNTFYNCVALDNVVIPDSVTVIGYSCFEGCSTLKNVTLPKSVNSVGSTAFSNCPSLTSVTIKSQAIASMSNLHKIFGEQATIYIFGDGVTSIGEEAFFNCDNLVSVTLLDGLTSIGGYAFWSCDNLISIKFPNSLTTIGEWAFANCTNLGFTSLPNDLTSIGSSAFANCTNLSTITLPAQLKNVGLYAFSECENLTEIYALPFTPPTNNNSFLDVPSNGVLYYPYGSDYSSWKKGGLADWEFVSDFTATECTNLTITANNVKWNETTTTINYTATVNGVDSLGYMVTGDVITGTTVSENFDENQSDETVERVVTFEFMGVTATTTILQSGNLKHLGFTPINGCQFTFTKNGNGDDIRYSIDNGVTWVVLPSGESTPQIQAGETIFWESSITPSDEGIGYFSSTGYFNARGNVMSLLYGDNFNGQTSLEGKDNAFKNLFRNCNYLIDTSNLILPATTLSQGCYRHMFSYCRSLTTVPELPATTLADSCYYYMFNYCSGLTKAPELPATTLANDCYKGMFCDCTSLTTAPELPATTLASGCYWNMFLACKNLTIAPELPATTMVDNCYFQMFNECESLTTAPELPATKLAYRCYGGMLGGCTSLTTAPELNATTLVDECYYCMFVGCTNLSHITMLATDIQTDDCLFNWVVGVSTSGTFVKHPDMTSLPTGIHGIPEGWTVEDYQG